MNEGGYSLLCIAVVVCPYTLASLSCRDGACRVLTDQKLLAPSAKRGGGKSAERFNESKRERFLFRCTARPGLGWRDGSRPFFKLGVGKAGEFK